MNRYDCEGASDLLPLLVRSELRGEEEAAVEAHVAMCTACAQEAEVVGLVYRAQAEVPVGLEPRVLAAVRGRAPARRWVPARWAMAATVAAAVVGGSMVFDRFMPRSGGQMGAVPGFLELEAAEATVLSWAAAEDPLLHGGSGLHTLSLEELEILLAELES